MSTPGAVGLALLAAAMWVAPASASSERLFYEVTVTAPGTRSQGWQGNLFDQGQQELATEPGKSIRTNAGTFVAVACNLPWIPCGFILEEQLRWMNANGGNFILVPGIWVYRLYVTAPCTRSEGWRGELLRNGRLVSTRARRHQTPMGMFVRKASPYLWGQKGWFHISWPRAKMAPGNWPCGAL